MVPALTPLALISRPAPEIIPTGIPDLDIPRGSVTEMAEVTAREEVCALIDTSGAFDPTTAAQAGVRLDRLLWIRCSGDAERALKAADLVIQSGGFGLVVFDLGDTPLRTARRISLTSWFRLRRAVEHTPTAIIVIAQEPLAKTSASLVLQLNRAQPLWKGKLFQGMEACVRSIKPAGE